MVDRFQQNWQGTQSVGASNAFPGEGILPVSLQFLSSQPTQAGGWQLFKGFFMETRKATTDPVSVYLLRVRLVLYSQPASCFIFSA